VSRAFPVKRLCDGRAMVNLGCGTRMHRGWNNVDFSYYARLVHRPRLTKTLRYVGLLSAERYARLQSIDPDMVRWDLRKGIPFPDATFDVVYHSHVLEHIDRVHVPTFLGECRRVLRSNGVLRVVVPDLKELIRNYCATLPASDSSPPPASDAHELAVDRLLEQMVREEPFGAGNQHAVVQAVERALRGDARKAGELHRWMYDRYTLRAALEAAGFTSVAFAQPTVSRIAGWANFGLDAEPDGSPYISGSLYAEAERAGEGR